MKFVLGTVFALFIIGKSDADIITLTNGERIDCNIKQVSSTALKAQAQNPSINAPETFSINLTDIKSVLLSRGAPDCTQAEPTAENLATLKAFWAAMHPLIGKGGTQITQAGLRLAAEALAKNTASVSAEEALTIVRCVKTTASEQSHRVQALAFEMRILAELGKFEEARAESLKWDDPRFPLPLRVSANLTAGICGHEAMRLFLFENPRWQEDVRVHRERSEIYERTMDAYIFAALFGSDQENVAQTALYHAAKFLMLCGDESHAKSIASTLRRRFQESAYATTIEDEISRSNQNPPVIGSKNAPVPSCMP
jgi:hypothetical protein